jgi:hypothetical protein
MKTVKIEVKNCKGCPFADYNKLSENNDYANCLAPYEIHVKYNITSYYKNYKKPKWCALNNTKLIITNE